jgi:predicted nucleotidyltransferase
MRNKIISYSIHFISFLLENNIVPRRAILFGSVVTGEYDKESDIDIFIDIDTSKEQEIRNSLKLFNRIFGEKWKLKGIENSISVIVGNINSKKWENLKRSIQSHAILLYGVYNEPPMDIKPYFLFRLNFRKMSRSQKIRIWRQLYGYTQKVGKKIYKKQGIVREYGGTKLEKSIVIVPSSKLFDFKQFLKKNNIDFLINELWLSEDEFG